MAYLAQLDDCDSPLIAASAARIGFQALCLARSAPGVGTDELRDRATLQLDRGRAGLTDEWRRTYYGVQLALAEAYAARFAGGPAVAQFRKRPHWRSRSAPTSPSSHAWTSPPSCSPTAAATRAASCSSSAGAPPTRWAPGSSSAASLGSPPVTGSRCPSRHHARAVEPAHTSRTRGPRPPRHRRNQQDDRDHTVHHREDRQRARLQHPLPSSTSPTAARPPPSPDSSSDDPRRWLAQLP